MDAVVIGKVQAEINRLLTCEKAVRALEGVPIDVRQRSAELLCESVCVLNAFVRGERREEKTAAGNAGAGTGEAGAVKPSAGDTTKRTRRAKQSK